MNRSTGEDRGVAPDKHASYVEQYWEEIADPPLVPSRANRVIGRVAVYGTVAALVVALPLLMVCSDNSTTDQTPAERCEYVDSRLC